MNSFFNRVFNNKNTRSSTPRRTGTIAGTTSSSSSPPLVPLDLP